MSSEPEAKRLRLESNAYFPNRIALGKDMVDLYVGPEGYEKHFYVHKKKLCDKIPYFKSMFMTGFSESIINTATFPEDDPTVFDYIIGLLYSGIPQPFTWHTPSHLTDDDRIVDAETFLSVYIFLDKICCFDLADEVVTQFFSGFPFNRSPKVAWLRNIWNETQDGWPIRNFVLLWISWFLRYPNLFLAHKDEHKNEITAFMSEEPQFQAAYISFCIDSQAVEQNPCWFSPVARGCTFHRHSMDAKCRARGRLFTWGSSVRLA